jgi:hypothetical protein
VEPKRCAFGANPSSGGLSPATFSPRKGVRKNARLATGYGEKGRAPATGKVILGFVKEDAFLVSVFSAFPSKRRAGAVCHAGPKHAEFQPTSLAAGFEWADPKGASSPVRLIKLGVGATLKARRLAGHSVRFL